MSFICRWLVERDIQKGNEEDETVEYLYILHDVLKYGCVLQTVHILLHGGEGETKLRVEMWRLSAHF